MSPTEICFWIQMSALCEQNEAEATDITYPIGVKWGELPEKLYERALAEGIVDRRMES